MLLTRHFKIIVLFPQLAQPIRMLLAYTETKYEDKYYVCGPAPTFDKSCWFDIKYSLGLDFPNVILKIGFILCRITLNWNLNKFSLYSCHIMLMEILRLLRAMPSSATLVEKIIFWELMKRREFEWIWWKTRLETSALPLSHCATILIL